MKIAVCCPSYKRPKVETLDYLPFCKVYVDPSEYEAYISENPKENIIKCDDGIQGNVGRVRNYILDKEFENGADVVLMVDDDLSSIGHFVGGVDVKVETEEFLPFVEKYSIMAMDLGAYFWGININPDYKCYREYTPFSTIAFIGGPFQCFINDGGLRYDERLPLKEDYDMSIQQCRKFRKVLRVNAYHYSCKQSKQKGGCATYRNAEKEIEQLKALRRKWGGQIVKSDAFSNKRKRKVIDYNPIIHIPIKGV